MSGRSITIKFTLACLFAALCASTAYIAIPIPISPVPITLQNLFVVLAGLLLGPLYGGSAVAIFLALGALGFPVFSGGRGGIAHFMGPTSGYLFSYLIAAVAAGLLGKKHTGKASLAASITGFLLILIGGTVRLSFLEGSTWQHALLIGFLPFFPIDIFKAVLCAILANRLGPFIDRISSSHR